MQGLERVGEEQRGDGREVFQGRCWVVGGWIGRDQKTGLGSDGNGGSKPYSWAVCPSQFVYS